MSVVVGQERRDVLVAAHLRRPVSMKLAPVVDELGGLGWIAVARPCPGGLELLLTSEGKREARRQWYAAWWMRWRDAAHRIDNRPAATPIERCVLSRRASRARDRALQAFHWMTALREVRHAG